MSLVFLTGRRNAFVGAGFALALLGALTACGGGGGSMQSMPTVQIPGTGNGSAQATPTASPAASPSPSATGSPAAEVVQAITLSGNDAAQAKAAANIQRHVMPVRASGSKSAAAASAPVQYLEDLGYGGGHVLTRVTEHDVYVSVTNAPPVQATWGNPYRFLQDLGESNFIHVTDQYTKTSGFYYPGQGLTISSTTFSYAPLYDNDVLAIAHAAASAIKRHGETGYERIYNLFFPPGVDICATFTTQCYSPDNFSTFAFCGYHESVDFPDIGHVILTVEPYQGVTVSLGGQTVAPCSAADPSSPDFLVSATDSTLSHETFEAITDPDPPMGWTVPFSNGGVAGGFEIGDLCDYAPIESVVLRSTLYHIQPEYSNQVHGCVSSGP